MKAHTSLEELRIETGTPLLLSIPGGMQGFKSSFVGFRSREYIIVEIPKTDEFDPQIALNDTIHGTFISSGTLVRFRSSVLNYMQKPARLVLASFPEFLDVRDLRRSKRMECRIPAVLKLYNDMPRYPGTIVDISLDGCRYHIDLGSMSKEQLPSGAKILLMLKADALQKKRILGGEIVNMEVNGPKLYLGIRFARNTEEELNCIDELISRTALFPPGNT